MQRWMPGDLIVIGLCCRIEQNGDKIISVDGLLLTNKKVDIGWVDERTMIVAGGAIFGFINFFRSVDENIQKKMQEYEATQEILLKRLTEKEKSITKTR